MTVGAEIRPAGRGEDAKIAVVGAGCVGGGFGTALAKAGVGVMLIARGGHLQVVPENGTRLAGVFHAGLLAFVICLMGFCGGLVMSAIKRDLGVKDWGSMIAGHGGILDRLDSVIFAAPVFFHVIRYWWTP
ncbi:MAG: phosphatidate cytidylyltransferase [Reyranellaceae bacterium]